MLSFSSLIVWLPFLFGLGSLQDERVVRRLVVQDEIIVRVPVRPAPRIVWVPGREFRCIPVSAIRGANLSGPQRLDLILARSRVRARLADDCPAIDFYGGFYLKPEDGRICAGRDIVYSRMGGSCPIEGFRQLVPKLGQTAVP